MSSHRIFDCHMHIIDPAFPLIPNNGYLPDPFTASDYQARVGGLHVAGGAVVSGSFQGFDQEYLVDALKRLGPGFVGVTQLPAETPDAEILRLNAAGVRAVRFNLFRGGSERLERLEEMAHRVYDLAGWHVEFYVDSRDLAELKPRLLALPKVSIDHLGMSADGLDVLLNLVEQGIRVKATGFGRVTLDVPSTLRAIWAANPEALMFGTDLPSTRAPRPFDDQDVELLLETLGDRASAQVLYDNAASFYGIAGDR